MRRQQFQHPASAGAGVEQVADGGTRNHADDRRFDFVVRRMQGADALPFRGIGFEEGGGFGGACLADGGQMLEVGIQNGR